MRSVCLDLGARHIAFTEVVGGKVTKRGSAQRFSELTDLLGPETPPARVAFEACREGWHVHDTLVSWGKEAFMLDTTRVTQIGIGHHKRKNDAIDSEAGAFALDRGQIPLAHVLSPARRELRKLLSVRGALVDTRAHYVTTIRGLARAKGVLLKTGATENFLMRLKESDLDQATRDLIEPLKQVLEIVNVEIAKVELKLSEIALNDDAIKRCASAPGVGLIVAATFVSVIDDAKRFQNAHSVGSYLGLVPSEASTGGPKKRRLGAITKQGNTYARTMLVQAAWQIMRSRDADDPLRRWALHIAKKRGKRIAAVALARKLACVMWTMWKNGAFYDPKYQATQTVEGMKLELVKQQQNVEVMADVEKRLGKKKPTTVEDRIKDRITKKLTRKGPKKSKATGGAATN